MEQELQDQKPEKNSNKILIITIILIVVIILVWAGLTKIGLIPNFFDINFLIPRARAL